MKKFSSFIFLICFFLWLGDFFVDDIKLSFFLWLKVFLVDHLDLKLFIEEEIGNLIYSMNVNLINWPFIFDIQQSFQVK